MVDYVHKKIVRQNIEKKPYNQSLFHDRVHDELTVHSTVFDEYLVVVSTGRNRSSNVETGCICLHRQWIVDRGQRLRLNMNSYRRDQVLQTISVLESKTAEVNDIATSKQKIMEDWRQSETHRLERQNLLHARQLENFIRSTDQKSILLAHGSIHLRLGMPKVTVIDEAAFIPISERLVLIRVTPATKEADLNAIHAYIRRVGTPPSGVAYTPATINFSHKTLKGPNNGQEQH